MQRCREAREPSGGWFDAHHPAHPLLQKGALTPRARLTLVTRKTTTVWVLLTSPWPRGPCPCPRTGAFPCSVPRESQPWGSSARRGPHRSAFTPVKSYPGQQTPLPRNPPLCHTGDTKRGGQHGGSRPAPGRVSRRRRALPKPRSDPPAGAGPAGAPCSLLAMLATQVSARLRSRLYPCRALPAASPGCRQRCSWSRHCCTPAMLPRPRRQRGHGRDRKSVV